MTGEIVARVYPHAPYWRDGASDPEGADKMPAILIFDGAVPEGAINMHQSAIYIERKTCPIGPVLEALKQNNVCVMRRSEPGPKGALLWFLIVEEKLHVFEARPWMLHRKHLAPRIDGLVEITAEGCPIFSGEDPMRVLFDRVNPLLEDPVIDDAFIESKTEAQTTIVCDLPLEIFRSRLEEIVRSGFLVAVDTDEGKQGEIRILITPPREAGAVLERKNFALHYTFGAVTPGWARRPFYDALEKAIFRAVVRLVAKTRYHGRRLRVSCIGPEPVRKSSWQIRNLPDVQEFKVLVGRSREEELLRERGTSVVH